MKSAGNGSRSLLPSKLSHCVGQKKADESWDESTVTSPFQKIQDGSGVEAQRSSCSYRILIKPSDTC
jgi:hypothetical protein